MQCVILAAGRGTRMKELTANTPKPMIAVFGEPLLAHKIRMLPETVDDVVLVVGYLGEQIREYFGSEWEGRKISYVFQKNLNGTGGAIREAKDLVCGTFLVIMGDDLYGTDDLARLSEDGMAVLAKKMDKPFSAGILRRNREGNLLEIVEKTETPEIGLMNTGAYALTRDFFEYELVQITKTEFGLPQTLATMAKNHPVKIKPAHSWLRIGCPEDIGMAEDFLRNNNRKTEK
ncbi:MAG: sugar phosphate nucleotidyltransferase [Candidatus Paceibacterota bacterium]|jgi:bifunctional UDP-N-acetylglucosamine pyrophosphorylase/glucosamine-1-phosphate N-acetyltransferase